MEENVESHRTPWNGQVQTLAAYSSFGVFPSPRHFLRKFFEHNAHILAACPLESFVVLDFTAPHPELGLARSVSPCVCV